MKPLFLTDISIQKRTESIILRKEQEHSMAIVQDILKQFQSVSLDEMDGVRLLNRKDTKFVFSAHLLPLVIERLKGHYRILEVDSHRISKYRTRYFDTPDHDFYLQHHNGWTDRYKVRFRSYEDTGDCFLEVKHKVKGRTKKTRKKVESMETTLSESSMVFVAKTMGYRPELTETISNEFKRITLVNKESKERVTLDSEITFEHAGEKKEMHHIIIAEVKQEYHSRDSLLMKVLRDLHIRPMKISKYCIGSIYLYDDIKYNRFKKKILTIQRLKNDLAS